MGATYWMVVLSPESFAITRELGFTVQGMGRRQHRKARQMHPQDRLLYYVTGLRAFAGTATVVSDYFEDHTPIWSSPVAGEDYPYRVKAKPDIVLEPQEYLDAHELGPTMLYVRKWTPEHWYLAFQGNLHIIPKDDFVLIEGEMEKIVRARSRVGPRA